MRVAFFGTPEPAVASLEALVAADDIDVVAVVTNPDRARGRSSRTVPPPVKAAAQAANLEVLQPAHPRDIVSELDAMALDACAVVAYGAILPSSVLQVPRLGFINLHFSLLPRWRGAAPVQHALRAGDTHTGVTTFLLDEGMDTGPVIAQQTVTIGDEETAGELLERLAELGAPVLVDALRARHAGAQPEPQPDQGVTLAPKINRDDVRIDWNEDARDIANLVRSADPRPGAFTTHRGRTLKIFRARPVDGHGPAGSIIQADRAGLVIACGSGALEVGDVQAEGKARMNADAFVHGYGPFDDDVLGDTTTSR